MVLLLTDLNYSVLLPSGTTTTPTVAGVSSDTNAKVVENQATTIPGNATVVVTAEDETIQITYQVTFSFSTGITTSESLQASIYPNPVKGKLYVNFGENNLGNLIIVTDASGKEVNRRIVNNSIEVIDLSSEKKGLYILRLISDSSNYTSKIILE